MWSPFYSCRNWGSNNLSDHPRSLKLINANAEIWIQHCLIPMPTFLLLKKVEEKIRISVGRVEGPPKSAIWVPTFLFQHLFLFWSFVVGPLKSGKHLFILEHMEFSYLPSDPLLLTLRLNKAISLFPCKIMRTIYLLSHRVVSIHSHFISPHYSLSFWFHGISMCSHSGL